MEDETRKPRVITRAPVPPEYIMRGTGGLSLRTQPRIEPAPPSNDVSEWVTAADLAVALSNKLGHTRFPAGSPDSKIEIAKWAAKGLLRARAANWFRGDEKQEDPNIPALFWKGGQVGYLGAWQLGRFSNRVELSWQQVEEWEVFGVTFAKDDALLMGVVFDQTTLATDRTGMAGRPSSSHILSGIMRARADRGEVCDGLAAEVTRVLELFSEDEANRNIRKPTLGAAKNALREDYRECKRISDSMK